MANEIVSKEIIEILANIGSLSNWLQALGIAFLLTIIFQIIAFFINRKKLKELKKIRAQLNIVENKLDRILKKNLR